MSGNPDVQLSAALQSLITPDYVNGCVNTSSRKNAHVLDAGHTVLCGVVLRGYNRGEDVFLTGLGQSMFNQTLSRVLEYACRVSIRVAHDDATGNVLCVLVDSSELHGQRVRQTHVPIGTIHEDRIVRRDVIDQLMRRQSCRSPTLVVPVAVQNPFALGAAAHETGDLFAELLRTGSFMQLHTGKTVSSHVEVNMGVIESGDDAAPFQLDHYGLFTR